MSVPSERDGSWAAEKRYLKEKISNLKSSIFCFKCVERSSSSYCHSWNVRTNVEFTNSVRRSTGNSLGYLKICANWIRASFQEELCSLMISLSGTWNAYISQIVFRSLKIMCIRPWQIPKLLPDGWNHLELRSHSLCLKWHYHLFGLTWPWCWTEQLLHSKERVNVPRGFGIRRVTMV